MFLYLNIIPHPLDESRDGLNGTPMDAPFNPSNCGF